MSAYLQQPTIEGKVDGVIQLDPVVLQCRECGLTATQDRPNIGAFMILSGFKFHLCAGQPWRRLCPSCLTADIAACPSTRCKR